MKAGRLSYTVDAAGQRRIDTAELDRVFGIIPRTGSRIESVNGAILVADARIGNGASGASACEALQSNTAHAGEHAALQQLLADREASIADLRGRLDASEAERRQLSERLHGVLVDRRETQGGTPPPFAANAGMPVLSASSGLAIPRSPWWRRWFR
jgi:hypothetical protein